MGRRAESLHGVTAAMSQPHAAQRARNTPRVTRGCAIVAVTIFLTTTESCRKSADPGPTPPRRVITHRVAAPQSVIRRSFSGATKAANTADLSFEVSGRIVELVAVRGRKYEAGAVLAKLDTSNYEVELRRAQAEATRAQEELRRVQQLFENDNTSRAQLDSAIATHQTASASLETAEKQVNDCTLYMPYAGHIGDVLSERQELVNAGTPVFTILGDGAMEMEIGVPSDVIGSVSIGMKARVRIGSIPGVELTASVSKISTQVSRNTTYAVTLALAEGGADLRDGMDGEATLELPNPRGGSIAVPAACVAAAPPDERYVWVVDGATAPSGETANVKKRVVTTGALWPQGEIEILSGLTAGETIVARGVHRLSDGARVRVSP